MARCDLANVGEREASTDKCFMEGCESPTPNADGDMRHRFCEAHTCKWKDCYGRVSLLDGYLCEEHLRPGDRDREGARARNPSDSGYGDFSEPRTYPGGSVAAGAAGGGVRLRSASVTILVPMEISPE